MDDYGLPNDLIDKIYEIKKDTNGISKLISYFPLSDDEKNKILIILGDKFSRGTFYSIFSDVVSDEDWIKTKHQIKKRFQDELFEID